MQSDGLRDYLSKSVTNFAVLTDYAAMEAYKGDTLASIHRSMEVLAQFPKQVIVLKGTQLVCGLRGRSAGLQRRMIDVLQTREFGVYCKNLLAAQAGNVNLQKSLLDHGREANAHMDRMLADVAGLPDALSGIADDYTDAEVKILRKGSELTEDIADKFYQHILLLTATLFRDHPRALKLPDATELPNTFIFRNALCMHVLTLEWISVGSPLKMKPERMRNDLVDLLFAAYATFFDGLLTADKKLDRTYQIASLLLSSLLDTKKN